MQDTPYILSLILAELLAADGAPRRSSQPWPPHCSTGAFDLRSNAPNPFNTQTTI